MFLAGLWPRPACRKWSVKDQSYQDILYSSRYGDLIYTKSTLLEENYNKKIDNTQHITLYFNGKSRINLILIQVWWLESVQDQSYQDISNPSRFGDWKVYRINPTRIHHTHPGMGTGECTESILPGYIIIIQVCGLDLYKEYTSRRKL